MLFLLLYSPLSFSFLFFFFHLFKFAYLLFNSSLLLLNPHLTSPLLSSPLFPLHFSPLLSFLRKYYFIIISISALYYHKTHLSPSYHYLVFVRFLILSSVHICLSPRFLLNFSRTSIILHSLEFSFR